MQPEDKLLFILTRQKFLETHQQKVQELCRTVKIDWDDVLSIALQHGVVTLVYTNLQQCDIEEFDLPAATKTKFETYYYANIAQKTGVVEMLKFILAYFNQRQIDLMLIKGAALDQLVYDNLGYTNLNDIDLVIKPRYEALSNQQQVAIKNFFLKFPAFEYDFFEHHDVTMNGSLAVDFEEIWRDAERISIKGEDVWVMSLEDMLIAVCINSCRKRFFKLKSLCDIAETIEEFPELNWARFIEKAKRYNCQNIVYAALLTTQFTVGCNLPKNLLFQLQINPVRAKIIRFLSWRMSLSSLDTLQAGYKFIGRSISVSLLLPYTTYKLDQILRKSAFVWRTRSVPAP